MTASFFPYLDATAQAELVASGQVRTGELVENAIDRIERINPAINAIIIPLFDKARAEATAAEGPFRGVPYVLKDLSLFSKGDPYVAGVSGLKKAGYRADHDSHFVTRMREAGFALVGRANSPELGILGPMEPLTWGWTRNPWNTAYQTGGGGGPAAAVAAGLVPVAHGNDGGGSVRITAGQNGVVGLMPSRGRISAGPAVRNSDNVAGMLREGLMTRSVRDVAAVLDIVSGHFPGDPYGAPSPARAFRDFAGTLPDKLRIGMLDTDPQADLAIDADCVAAVRNAATALRELGHIVEPAYPAALRHGAWPPAFNACLAVVVRRELALFGQMIGRPLTEEDVEPVTWRYAELGAAVTGEQYAAGVDSIRQHAAAIESWWADDGWDLLLSPTLPLIPPPANSDDQQDGAFLDLATVLTRYTAPFNISGQPSISLPLHWTASGLPVGVQIVAAFGREDLLLQVASQLETAMPWAGRHPISTGE